MRTERACLGFVLLAVLAVGCNDDSTGSATDTTGTPGTTSAGSTSSGSTGGSSSGVTPTTAVDPTTGASSSSTSADGTTSASGTTGVVDPSTTSGTSGGDGTSTGGGETTGEVIASSSESSSGGDESTGEPVVCPPAQPDSGQCEACLETQCCTEYDECFADEKCTCIFNCIFQTNGPMGCAFQCMNVGMQNPTLGAMFICGQECPGCPW